MTNNQTYDKNFTPKPIADLLNGKYHFVIPSFQRGYRWEQKQVLDLLEDIKQFANDNNSGNSYFLQPIVVKPTRTLNEYEVLDGQQRLTTMLLLLKRLVKRLVEEERDIYKDNIYNIIYTNRPQLDFDNPNPSDNIDSYYLDEAKNVIDKWFKKQFEQKQNLNNFTGTLLYNQEKQVKIIWYVIDNNSTDLVSINIFNRLNKGKISLTSSELIKALFVMDYDLRANGNKLPAEQLSMEWNEMERKFQDDNFWYFISDNTPDIQTRIDVLFDFVTCKSKENDTDYSYREFQKLYDMCRASESKQNSKKELGEWAQSIDNMQDAWKEVRRTYDRLLAWYEDSLYYHYVGYLVTVGFSPLEIYQYLEGEKANRKKDSYAPEWTTANTTLALQRKIMDRFKKDSRHLDIEEIAELEYHNTDFVRRLLLLFNIETYRTSENMRFPFSKYKKEHWDIEHIDSQNESSLQEFNERIQWLQNVKFILKKEGTERSSELVGQCENLIKEFEKNERINLQKYQDFYQVINKHYTKEAYENETEVDLTTKGKDSISNLTLLDSSTNREYKDAPFAYKRHCIIEKDKEGTKFIPLCTRNVFLKYYSNSEKNTSYLDTMRWNEDDKKDYINAIYKKVEVVFNSVKLKENNNE